MNVLLHYRPLDKTFQYLRTQRDNSYVSYLAPIHREDGEAVWVAAIPLLKSLPRDRMLRRIGIYFQPKNPIQVLRPRWTRMTYSAAVVFSQEIFPFSQESNSAGAILHASVFGLKIFAGWPPDVPFAGGALVTVARLLASGLSRDALARHASRNHASSRIEKADLSARATQI
jgi:hypothetical protein